MFLTDIAIDLGTTTTTIYEKKKGTVLCEPSVIAIDKAAQKVIATGDEAYSIFGKEPKNIEVIWPLKNGIIADAEALEIMLSEFIKRAKIIGTVTKPRIIISAPTDITQLEKDILKDCLLKVGARKILIESSIKAAALGVGLNIKKPTASMIIDIGGTHTDIGVMSLNDIVKYKSLRIGGQTFDKDIANYIKAKYKVLIGEITAKKIKEKYVDIYKEYKNDIEIKGKHLSTGLPTTAIISAHELKLAVNDSIEKIANAIIEVLEQISPELSAEIVEKGIVITGGSAKLNGLSEKIKDKVNVSTFIAEYPSKTTIEGLVMLLN